MFAPQASVEAIDIHGNAERVVECDSGLYARLAEWVPKLPGTLRLLEQAFAVSLTPLEAVGLLAGFSYAVGQSVNDIITLLRNPDQLLAFIDLAKAIYERPTILPTLIEAFVGTFQRFQNVQNPFPGPQNLLNPTNPRTFTTDNSTFGRTWFGGYALAFVTLGIATSGASAVGLTALEGVSATLANTIRFVISAPSLLATRAAGLLGRTALRVAVRIGRATELRVGAVKRALDGLATPRLQRVSRRVRNTDSDLEEVVADGCGGGLTLGAGDCLDEAYTRYVRETVDYNGRDLLDRLPDAVVRQLLGEVEPGVQRVLARAWNDPDAGVDAADVRRVAARYADLDAADQRTVARMASETDPSNIPTFAEFDADQLGRFARLRRASDLDAAGVQELLRFVELRRVDGFDNGQAVGERVTIDDLLTVGAKAENDMSDTIFVAKDGAGRLRWLEYGDEEEGWAHVVDRHITGMLPGGSLFRGKTRTEVKRLVMEAIQERRGIRQPDGSIEYVSRDPIVGEFKVIVSPAGRIITSFPTNP